MHAYLIVRLGRSYAVVREERGERTIVESGLGWDEARARRAHHERRDPPIAEPEPPTEPPRCESQPGRRKFAKPRELTKAGRSRVKWRRPYCLACDQFMPAPDEPREYWLEPNGHRAPSGEVCPGGAHIVVLSPLDRRVLQAMQAATQDARAADNTNGPRAAAKHKLRKLRRKKRRTGRQKRRRWVQLLLVDTPVVTRPRREKVVRAVVVPRWTQLGIEAWLDPPQALAQPIDQQIQPAARATA